MKFVLAVGLILVSSPALAAVVAEQQTSPAKGTKSCTIQSFTDPAPIVVVVHKGGSVALEVIADTFPGTRSFFLIGGKRYAGRGSVTVAVGPLTKEQPVQFTYTSWPENYDVNGQATLDGFAAAYAECKAFMG